MKLRVTSSNPRIIKSIKNQVNSSWFPKIVSPELFLYFVLFFCRNQISFHSILSSKRCIYEKCIFKLEEDWKIRGLTEAALYRSFYEKVLWKYAANLQENTHAKVPFTESNFTESKTTLLKSHFGRSVPL